MTPYMLWSTACPVSVNPEATVDTALDALSRAARLSDRSYPTSDFAAVERAESAEAGGRSRRVGAPGRCGDAGRSTGTRPRPRWPRGGLGDPDGPPTSVQQRVAPHVAGPRGAGGLRPGARPRRGGPSARHWRLQLDRGTRTAATARPASGARRRCWQSSETDQYVQLDILG